MKTKESRNNKTGFPTKENSSLILAVDDSADMRNLLSDILVKGNYRVRTASDGPTALESIANELPNLIILDIKMPDMDGYETALRIRQHPHGRSVHLIALTGWGQEQDRRRMHPSEGKRAPGVSRRPRDGSGATARSAVSFGSLEFPSAIIQV